MWGWGLEGAGWGGWGVVGGRVGVRGIVGGGGGELVFSKYLRHHRSVDRKVNKTCPDNTHTLWSLSREHFGISHRITDTGLH